MVLCAELEEVVLGGDNVLVLGECPLADAFPCPRVHCFLFFSSDVGGPQMRKGLCCILQRLCSLLRAMYASSVGRYDSIRIHWREQKQREGKL